MAGVNPFQEFGLNTNDPNMFQSMMNTPQFYQQMSSLLADPAILDQIIASNPQLAAMGPQVRAAFQSPQFREMMSNPERLQQMMQMASTLRQAGYNPLSNPYGGPMAMPPLPFQAPGMPSTTSPLTQQSPSVPGATATGTTPNTTNPGAANQGSRLPGAGAGSPFGMMDPALMQQLLAMGPFGAGGFGAFGGSPLQPSPSPAAPADARAPEERFQVQLQQLQDMGFTNASQNVRALLATGGNVQSAIEYILDGGGL